MIKIIIDSTHLKIFYDDATEEESTKSEMILRTKFCAHDKSLARDPRVLKKLMSDVRSFYNDTYNILPTGFWLYLEHYYNEANLQFEVTDLRKFPFVDKDFIRKLLKDEIMFNGEMPRLYQKEAVVELIKMKGGIISSSMGSGKTLIMALLLHIYSKANFLIMFDTLDLIEQTYHELIKYGFSESDLGVIQGNSCNTVKRITLLSIQSYEKAFSLFPKIHGIICDEVHSTGRTGTAEKIIYGCQSCALKIGLSATPWNDNDYQTMRLYGNIGPIIFQREIKEHIDEKYLTPTSIEIYSYNCAPVGIKGYWQDKYDIQKINSKQHKANLKKSNYEFYIDNDTEYARKLIDYGDEYIHFVNNEIRNSLIVQIIDKYVKQKKRILVMFNRIEHGEIIKKLYPKAILIHGEHNINERLAAEQYLVDNNGSVIIVSKIWAQGKNIPLADCIINIAGGKSSVRTVQKLGRVVRLAKGKMEAIVIDFNDACLSPIGKRPQNQVKAPIIQDGSPGPGKP